MSEIFGEALAHELARDLAGTRVVPLAAIEPDLDPKVHHTNLPYAIISDRHTIAIVEGFKIAIDGPQRTNNANRYAKTPAEIEDNRAEIARVARAWGVTAPAEHGGLVDTALSIIRFLKQRGTWWVYVAGCHDGLEGHVSARSGNQRWPAALHLQSIEHGIRVTCGDTVRELQSLAELADFASREAAILDAQVVWCTQFVAQLPAIEPVARAVVEVARSTSPAHIWSYSLPQDYFQLDSRPEAQLVATDLERIAGTVGRTATGFRVTIGDRALELDGAAAVSARCEELRDAIVAWLASPAAIPPVRDLSYYR